MTTTTKLHELYREVQNELEGLVPYSKQIIPNLGELNSKRVLGRCSVEYGTFKISLSKYLRECSEELIKNVIAHEIIHTVSGCLNHGWKFRYYADLVNRKLNYDIEVKNTKKEFNPPHKYKLTCLKCGKIYYRDRIIHRGDYFCGKDYGKLKIEKIV